MMCHPWFQQLKLVVIDGSLNECISFSMESIFVFWTLYLDCLMSFFFKKKNGLFESLSYKIWVVLFKLFWGFIGIFRLQMPLQEPVFKLFCRLLFQALHLLKVFFFTSILSILRVCKLFFIFSLYFLLFFFFFYFELLLLNQCQCILGFQT